MILSAGVAATWLGAVGTTRYVDDNTCPATGSGTPGNPYCHIQDAICPAVSGDSVSVAPGIYLESIRMKPGVSVTSTGGAAVTTINGAGKPCTETDFCTKRAGSQCSVVIFGSGHTTATHLEGFTITGGAGLPYPTAGPTQIAGGGIFIFSSPTIMNNVITNNVLAGAQNEYDGAGVYVAAGIPVISNNTITGNRAVPGPGTSINNPTFGYGGGIFSAFMADPQITSNVISGNWAGDPNIAFQLGSGGGIVLHPGDSGHIGPFVDRNLIADNISHFIGGGVSLDNTANTAAPGTVSNNVIVGNTANSRGGGVYTYFNRARIINNTITGNTATVNGLGGGIYSGGSSSALPVTILNNIIEGNHVPAIGGTGGGIYAHDPNQVFVPTVTNNDLFGNDKNQIAGDLTDATVIGFNGNFSLDPRYVNKPTRDFHLDPNSPAIDRGTTTLAPPIDKDGLPRGVDGNGIPNNPVAGDIDVGAYEKQSGCVPSTEVCDGFDNNCNSQVDEGFPDTDGDGLHDCVDPDDDNDGVLDGSDCAPLDSGAFALPAEIANLDISAASMVSYDTQNIGSVSRYDVISGLASRLGATQSLNEDFCAASYMNGGSWQDNRPAPRAGDAWFYLALVRNACGRGTLGSPQADQPRPSMVCETSIMDLDNDGSPSDLDCNDNNALQAPINPELCDNLDNNCNQTIDEGNPGGGASCGSNVGTCQFGSMVCTSGSLTCSGGIGPGPEFCDGLDNDCDGVPDNHVVDTDFDGQNDCVDTDDDNDGVLDVSDCAPRDATAFGAPVEVQDLDVVGSSSTTISWTNQTIGSGTRYDVASGQISDVGIIDFPSGVCLPGTAASPAVDNRTAPAAGLTWYYMVKSRNGCGPGTYGSPASDTHPACP